MNNIQQISRVQQRNERAQKSREAFFAFVKDHPDRTRKEICAILSVSLGFRFTRNHIQAAMRYYKGQITLTHSGHGKHFVTRYKLREIENPITKNPCLRLVDFSKMPDGSERLDGWNAQPLRKLTYGIGSSFGMMEKA